MTNCNSCSMENTQESTQRSKRACRADLNQQERLDEDVTPKQKLTMFYDNYDLGKSIETWSSLGLTGRKLADVIFKKSVLNPDQVEFSIRKNSFWAKICHDIVNSNEVLDVIWLYALWMNNFQDCRYQFNEIAKHVNSPFVVPVYVNFRSECFCKLPANNENQMKYLDKITCNKCNRSFHHICIGLDLKEKLYTCEDCNGEARTYLKLFDNEVDSDTDEWLDDIETEIDTDSDSETEICFAQETMDDDIHENTEFEIKSPIDEQKEIIPEHFSIQIPHSSYLTISDTLVKKDNSGRSFFSKDWKNVFNLEIKKIIKGCIMNYRRHEIISQKTNRKSKFFKSEAYCNRNGCSIVLKLFKTELPEENKDVEIMITVSGTNDHLDSWKAGQLTGDRRKKIKEMLISQNPSVVERKLYRNADNNSLELGNLTDVPNLKVLQQAKFEEMSKNDDSTDIIEDLKIKKLRYDQDLKCIHVQGYIQDISVDPFRVIMYSENQLKFAKEYIQSNPSIIIHFDSTGSVVYDCNNKMVLYYALVICDKEHNFKIPIAEMLSTIGDVTNLGYFLQHFMRNLKIVMNRNMKFVLKRFEIDFSKAMISTVTFSCGYITVADYLNDLFLKIWNNDKSEIMVLHICRFHITEAFRKKIKEIYVKNLSTLNWDIVHDQLFKWLYGFFYVTDLWSMHRRIEEILQ